MTSRASGKRAGPPSPLVSTAAVQPPLAALQQLTQASKISASCIALSYGFVVHFALFASRHASQGHLDVDLARRKVYGSNAGMAVEDSLLTYSQISKNNSALWVFCIDQHQSGVDTNYPISRIYDLEFNGLTRIGPDRFSYAELYPCSTACSTQRHPCPTCLQLSPSSSINLKMEMDEPNSTMSSSPDPCRCSSRLPTACHFARHPLRQPLAFFLAALQERIINDICDNIFLSGTAARRLQTGILWAPPNPSATWGDGWDQHWKVRSLTFCHIEVSLLASGIFVQPHFRPTQFLPFLPSLPIDPGTPINLLPFSTPAYYLNMYSGSTSVLTKQFRTNLMGLGTGTALTSNQINPKSYVFEDAVQFVIAWISVQNKQGEEKGMMVIWPAPLCVSLMNMSYTQDDSNSSTTLFAYNRKPLAYIPELPPALQPSPVPAPATVRVSSPQDSLVSPSLFTPIGRTSFSCETTPTTPFPPRSAQLRKNEPEQERPPLIRATSSFSSETTHAFRTLSISQLPPSGMRNVAEGVGKFVDFMAKERERERERIRREKEASNIAALTAKGIGTPQSPGVPPPPTSRILNTLQAAATLDFSHLVNGPAQMTPSITVNTQELAIHPANENQQLPVPPNQPSYPSPPEEPRKAEQASQFSIDGSLESYALNGATNNTQQVQEVGPSETFDSFDGMDKFMIDLGMDFNMSIPSSGEHHQGENAKIDLDSLGVFTDDDFSFFDDPVVTTTSTNTFPAALAEVSGLNGDNALTSLGIPPLVTDAVHSSVPDTGPSLSSFMKLPPWDMAKSAENSDLRERGEVSAPELLPGSPDESSSSSFGPATPEIISTRDAEILSSDKNPFDQIRFSKEFHSADAKYAIGKFSNSFIEKQNALKRETSLTVLWRMSYNSLTDPRIEVVKKLIGMKRRMTMQGVRLGPPCPPGIQETRSEWESCCDVDDGSVADADSERDSDDEYQMNVDDAEHDGIVDSVSRASTPALASHLPLGPTLLSTQFQHSFLLPLSVNLRPPGSSFAAGLDMASPLPNPVPTPVSPAAVVGSANEKTKALEVVVRTLASEVVENAAWTTAWRASAISHAPIWKQSDHEAAEHDSSYFLTGWLWDMSSIESYSSFASTDSAAVNFKPDGSKHGLKTLEQPMFTVGKADALVQMSPPALRFWSKMGLTPRSGPKDVLTFVLYEDGSPLVDVENWLSRISAMYTTKGYGKHSLGKSSLFPKEGFIPVRFATFRKTLASLLESVGTPSSPLLIYVVIPSSIISLSSPVLRQILTSINRVLSRREGDDDTTPVLFHLVPDFFPGFKDDIVSASQLDTFVDNVYNRIPRPVDRFMSRPLFALNEKRRKYMEAPYITLARTSAPTMSLSFQHPPPDFSSLDRHTLLHVGYRLSKCKKWLIAACIDQRGEGHNLGVWLAGDERDYKQHVGHVWRFMIEFAGRANVEWRIVIAKLGSVEEAELEAWNSLLNDEMSGDRQSAAMHVSILCVDDESGWSVLPDEDVRSSQQPPSSQDSLHGKSQNQTQSQGQGQGQGQGQLFRPISSTYILPSLRCPLPANIDYELGAQQYIPEDDEGASSSAVPRGFADRLRPLLSSALIAAVSAASRSRGGPPSSQAHAQARAKALLVHLLCAAAFPRSSLTKTAEETHGDVCASYHELVLLTEARWRHHNEYLRTRTLSPPLPYHLSALRIVDSCLELCEAAAE